MPMRGIPVARDVEHWLSRIPAEQRAALEKLHAQIAAAAPGAELAISYGMPTFKLHGSLVAYGAFKNHLSFFPMSAKLIGQLPEAKPFATSKGTMQFTPDRPIPAALVKKIVQARIAQNLEIAGERARAKKKAAAKPRPPSKSKPGAKPKSKR